MNRTVSLLERIAALIQQSVREDAAAHGLLPIQLQVLGYLARANHYSDMSIAVAEFFGITRGTVSQTVAVLERKALVTRKPDPRHRKRVHLKLTAKGRRVLTDSWASRLQTVLENDPACDEETLEAGLTGLLTALQRQNHHQAFNICHQCAHFLKEQRGYRCGLTGEPLAKEQTTKICREWTLPKGRAATG